MMKNCEMSTTEEENRRLMAMQEFHRGETIVNLLQFCKLVHIGWLS